MTAHLYELVYRDKFQAHKGFITAADLVEAFAVGRAWCAREGKTFVIVTNIVLAGAEILHGKQAPPAPE